MAIDKQNSPTSLAVSWQENLPGISVDLTVTGTGCLDGDNTCTWGGPKAGSHSTTKVAGLSTETLSSPERTTRAASVTEQENGLPAIK